MSDNKTSNNFWQRAGRATPYPRLRQTDNTCVFVSAAAAINHVCGRAVWDEPMLVAAFIQQGGGGATFTSVMKVAEAPVPNEIEWKDHWDEPAKPPLAIEDVAAWLRHGGVVVASLERAVPDATGLKRAGKWHMFTLISEDGDYFEVWDTNGLAGFVTKDELNTGILYPSGVWYVVHDRHNMLFVRRKA
jgi:hypothetical protein